MSEASTREAAATPAEPESGPRRWTLRQRIVLSLIVWAGYWFIRLLGPTLRLSVSYEEGAQKTLDERPFIASSWHSCLIPATYIFRDMGVRVMSSFSYDGEYMGRIIRRFGFVAVKGSSSRNPVRALLGLRRALAEGWTVAFTLDGPRGPRRKVKPGPVALARSTGLALTTFHAAVDKAWVLNSWDRMMIPKPFSRVLVRVGKLIPVPTDASEEDLERYTTELQATLDRVCAFAEENVAKAGTGEFPYYKS
ncbi:MAG: lysophospholipid acyltransferase family protein [Candidatus Sulfotelmatobacter sp.]